MDFVDIIKKAGYKCTQERLAILSFMNKKGRPRTPAEIHRGVQENRVDLATVYRTVDLFQKIGIVFSEEIMGEKRYFLATHEHHHIVCRSCKKISCVPCNIRIPNPPGFSHIQHEFTLTGICNNCSK